MTSDQFVTPAVRILYPNTLFTGRQKSNGKTDYGIVILIPKASPHIKLFADICHAAAAALWGADVKALLRTGDIRSPILDGDAKRRPEYLQGHWFLRTPANRKPPVFDVHKTPITSGDGLASGSWARAHLRAFTWTEKGQRGVSFGLNAIQILKPAVGSEVIVTYDPTQPFAPLSEADEAALGIAPGGDPFASPGVPVPPPPAAPANGAPQKPTEAGYYAQAPLGSSLFPETPSTTGGALNDDLPF